MFSYSERCAKDYWGAVNSRSDSIRVARVFCIFFMSYVHLHFFALDLYASDVYKVIRTVLVDVLGRSSVPLLSIISGFLAWGVFQREKSSRVFKNRARKILVPMIIWNSIGAALISFKVGSFSGFEFFNSVLPLAAPGAYTHLDFLRDIYVMTLATPLLICLVRRAPLLLLVAAIGVLFYDLNMYFVLRNQIFFFYAVGLFFAVYKIDFAASDFLIGLLSAFVFVGVCVVEVAELYGYDSTGYYYDNFVRRPLMVVFSWCLCVWLARGYFSRVFVYLERYVFLFFLSHVFIFSLIGAVFYRFKFLHSDIAYAVVWLVSPVVAYFLVVVVRNFCTGLSRRATSMVGVS
jgi:hypothetical protein